MKSANEYIKEIYSRLVNIYPGKPWCKSLEAKEKMGKNFLMKAGSAELRNIITKGLVCFERNGYDGSTTIEKDYIEEAIYFISQVIPYCESVKENGYGPSNIIKRLYGAFSNDDDMRAIRFEFMMVNYFLHKKCKIDFPDECKGSETYDLLIHPPYGLSFEVECKSFSEDKGATITLDEGSTLIDAIINEHGKNLDFLSPGKLKSKIFSIDISIPFPTKNIDKKNLANNIFEMISDKEIKPCDEFSIDILEFNIDDNYLEDTDKVELVSDKTDPLLAEVSKLNGGEAALISHKCKDGGFICFRVSSSLKDRFWKEVTNVAKKAIKDQLTGTRPAVVALQFTNESVERFSTIFSEDNNYNKITSRYFKYKYIVNFIFAGEILRNKVDNYPIKVDNYMIVPIRNEKSYYESGGIYLLLGGKLKGNSAL
ncbi:hypothetical protein [Pectobacterium polaris]|uniref:hypothetical protein n=1 Tax=Pectobacterium polaris TaxID=2042057 RepID=UPI001F1D2ED0|nr:hypothetical protein [Pectobacterium polaris]